MKGIVLSLDIEKTARILAGLLCSLAFHWWMLSRSIDWATIHPSDPSRVVDEPFEIVELPKTIESDRRKRSVVQTEDAGNREEDENARYFSDRTQKARADERASRIDEFKAGTRSFEREQAPQSVTPIAPGSAFPPDLAESDPQGILTPKQLENLSLKDLSVKNGDVASNDSVDKDVSSGARTVLSTREFRYFSYYQRIRDLLRQHWGPNVQSKLMRLWQMGKVVDAEEWTTQLHILLDQTGRVQKIAKISGCGIADIDSAAVEAFQRAGPFPNPPKGLLDEDGFVRINWSFVLTTEASPRVQFSAPGYGPR